jgi:hypothetical protein
LDAALRAAQITATQNTSGKRSCPPKHEHILENPKSLLFSVSETKMLRPGICEKFFILRGLNCYSIPFTSRVAARRPATATVTVAKPKNFATENEKSNKCGQILACNTAVVWQVLLGVEQRLGRDETTISS